MDFCLYALQYIWESNILIFSKCKQKLSHKFLSPVLPSFVNDYIFPGLLYDSEFRKFQLENVLRIISRSPGSGILSFFISFPLLLLTNHISQSTQTFCFTCFSTPIRKTFSPQKREFYSFYISIIKNLK